VGGDRAGAAGYGDAQLEYGEDGEPIQQKTPLLNVRQLRETMDLSQPDFAERFGFNLSTLRQWEQRRRLPDGSARVLLAVICYAPDTVDAALRALQEMQTLLEA
jgi:DNA-binding transcriptional regulator YiaG